MRRGAFAAVLASGLLIAGPVLAVPVTWYVSGTWSDGGSYVGSFVYDADTNTYSSVSITSYDGSLPTANYVAASVPHSGASQLTLLTVGGPVVGERVTRLTFSAPLTNGGGLVTPGGSTGEGTCNVTCSDYAGGVPLRTTAGGLYSSTPPPAPTLGEWAMIGFAAALAALGGLFVSRRRRLSA